MNSSDEIKNAVLRLYEAITARDMNAIARLFSRQNGVRVIGSDANEWWAD